MINKIQFEVCNQKGNPEAYKECEAFIKKMQKIMRLEDWDIDLEFLSTSDFIRETDTTGVAACTTNVKLKYALISVNCENQEINDDLECTLIHEMCHIVAQVYKYVITKHGGEDRWLNVLQEQEVENYAKSIWNALNEKPN